MKKLSLRTADKLLELGYYSMEALSLLMEDNLCDANIPIGQMTLLVHSLKQTFPWGQAALEKRANLDTQMNTDGEQRARTVGDDDVFIRNVLGKWHEAQAQQQPSHIGSNGNYTNGIYSWQDPQIYLKSLTPCLFNCLILNGIRNLSIDINLSPQQVEVDHHPSSSKDAFFFFFLNSNIRPSNGGKNYLFIC